MAQVIDDRNVGTYNMIGIPNYSAIAAAMHEAKDKVMVHQAPAFKAQVCVPADVGALRPLGSQLSSCGGSPSLAHTACMPPSATPRVLSQSLIRKLSARSLMSKSKKPVDQRQIDIGRSMSERPTSPLKAIVLSPSSRVVPVENGVDYTDQPVAEVWSNNGATAPSVDAYAQGYATSPQAPASQRQQSRYSPAHQEEYPGGVDQGGYELAAVTSPHRHHHRHHGSPPSDGGSKTLEHQSWHLQSFYKEVGLKGAPGGGGSDGGAGRRTASAQVPAHQRWHSVDERNFGMTPWLMGGSCGVVVQWCGRVGVRSWLLIECAFRRVCVGGPGAGQWVATLSTSSATNLASVDRRTSP